VLHINSFFSNIRYNKQTDLVEMSTVRFKQKDLKFLGRASMGILEGLGLLAVARDLGTDREFIECNNFTLINLILKIFGPMREKNTTVIILLIQVCVQVENKSMLQANINHNIPFDVCLLQKVKTSWEGKFQSNYACNLFANMNSV